MNYCRAYVSRTGQVLRYGFWTEAERDRYDQRMTRLGYTIDTSPCPVHGSTS